MLEDIGGDIRVEACEKQWRYRNKGVTTDGFVLHELANWRLAFRRSNSDIAPSAGQKLLLRATMDVLLCG